MKEEIEVAIQWWIKVLDGPKHDAVDLAINLLLKSAPSILPLTEEQKKKFADYLRENLPIKMKDYWDENRPNWGGYFRTLAVDYGPDKFLNNAAIAAGFGDQFRFPIKTCMWIDPRKVTVRNGYHGKEEVIFQKLI